MARKSFSFASTAGGIKDLGTGIAIIGSVILVFYVIKQMRAIADQARAAAGAVADTVQAGYENVKQGAGYVFGAESAPSTIGTSLFDFFNPAPAATVLDEPQAIKSCNAMWKRDGYVTGDICLTLQAQGKLTPPENG